MTVVLDTPRLSLRWFAPADAPFVRELLNDAGWLQFIGDRGVRSDDEARDYIEHRLRADCLRQGFGLWAMQRRSDGERLGMCGLVKRDSLPEIDVGYALLERFRGAGYAREAAAACLQHARSALGLTRVLAITRPDNERSSRLLRSLGMRLERREQLAGDAHESLVFAWSAPDSDASP